MPAVSKDSHHKAHSYTILPNFWGVQKRNEPDPSVRIGRLVIERYRSAANRWDYEVVHHNTTSGELLTLEYSCTDGPLRNLHTPWRVRARNDADGVYGALDWKGMHSVEGSERKISIETSRGLLVNAGHLAEDVAFTSNWSLFDVLPIINQGTGGEDCVTGLAVLEDLEFLRENCSIKPLEEWNYEYAGVVCRLKCYVLSGNALPPSYWWLTDSGDVAAMATMLSTYVLQERKTAAL